MSLHPQSREILRAASTFDKAAGHMTIEDVRAENARLQRMFSADLEPVARVEDITIVGKETPISVRLFYPYTNPSGLLVYLHGGGWSVGSVELSEPQARALTNAGRCVVLSVEYRLAPEHPFPAGLEDAFSATSWAAENAEELGVSPDRIAIGGESSGANMAAAVCLMARDRQGPPLAGQMLVVPAMARDIKTPSRRELATGYLLGADQLRWFWDQYLRPSQDASDPYISPLLVSDASNLPPAIVATAEYDLLRDEGEAYAARLRNAGVATVLRRFPGVLHGFLGQAGVVPSAAVAFDWIGAGLRRCFNDEWNTEIETRGPGFELEDRGSI